MAKKRALIFGTSKFYDFKLQYFNYCCLNLNSIQPGSYQGEIKNERNILTFDDLLSRAAVDVLLVAVGLQHLVEDVHFALERKQTHETEVWLTLKCQIKNPLIAKA